MPTVREARLEGPTLLGTLDRVLGRIMRPLANLLPRRLRRAAERIERERRRPLGQLMAAGFLFIAFLYAVAVGGQIGRLADSLVVFLGFGIEDVKITGEKETSEIAVLEKLDIAGSLIAFDAAAAQERLKELPWVDHAIVRKFYPGTLAIEITERKPLALWQRNGEVAVIDQSGKAFLPLHESRFASLPLVVGGGANEAAPAFLGELLSRPTLAEEMRAAVWVAERRWDLHLDHGVTVELPERNVGEALAQLAKLDTDKQILSRDVVVIDLRLPDRVVVRLPEGRSLDEITSEAPPPPAHGKTRT